MTILHILEQRLASAQNEWLHDEPDLVHESRVHQARDQRRPADVS